MNQPGIRIRSATSDDLEAIMTALERLSDEIPVKMERRQILRQIVAECCKQKSWVALDEAGHLAGFLLGKTCTDRPGYVGDGFTLLYGGVLAGYRKQGLFFCLLSKAKELKRPLDASVSHENKSGMAARLAREGFTKYLQCPKEDYFIWTPQ